MPAVVLTDAEKSRRNKLAGMLGSSHDGEVVNAARFLQKMASEKKLTLVELLTAGNGASSSRHNDRYERYEPPPRDDYGLPEDWRSRLNLALALHSREPFLTAWEEEFASDVYSRGMRHPTQRQAVYILRIFEKSDRAQRRRHHASEEWEDA